MIDLARHIEALLLENDCVIVPGLGGFIAHHVPAMRAEEEGLFLPPSRLIGFNPRLLINDGVLVQSYMSAYGTNFVDATRRIEKEVALLIEQLQRDGEVALENIGQLRHDIRGNYLFTPYEEKLVTPSLYGLEPFQLAELAARRMPERTPIPITTRTSGKQEETKAVYAARTGRSFLRYAAAAAAIFLLFFAFPTSTQNTKPYANGYARLLPDELFAAKRDPVPAKQDAAPATPQDTAAIEHPQPRLSRPQPVPMIKIKNVDKPAPSSSRYHLVVAAGIGLKSAEALAERLKAEGHSEARVLTAEGKVRVVIRSLSDRAEAIKALMELREEPGYQNSWMLTD
ncbi:MAG: SPOR domain-containing protein [Mediterranea sp.]|jgi:cell division septation protein DedD|nr:SPOR domain-containing protein [Mediterranea sp.]